MDGHQLHAHIVSGDPAGQVSVALLIVGDEILSGRTRDENAAFLTGALSRAGARVARVVVVPDDVDAIAGEVRELASRYDYLITTGGVGPTHDDMTPAAVGKAFDTPCEVHPELERMLVEAYGDRVNDAALRMAVVPVGTEIITAQGVTFPPFRFRNVVMLPGVPRYVRNKFFLIAPLLGGSAPYRRELIVPVDEIEIADLLAVVAERNRDLRIGSYPVTDPDGGLQGVEVTVTGRESQRVEECVRDLLASLPGASRKEEEAEEHGV